MNRPWVLPLILLLLGCAPGPTNVNVPVTPVTIVLHFCADESPLYFAYKSDDGPWTHADLIANSVSIAAGARVILAAVSPPGYYRRIDFLFITAQELQQLSQPACGPGAGTRTLRGTIAGMTTNDYASVYLGPTSTSVGSSTPTFTIFRAPDTAATLVAARASGPTASRVIVRRAVNVPDGSTMPPLDFNSPEAVSLVSTTVTFSGLDSDSSQYSVNYMTARNAAIHLQSSSSRGNGSLLSVPGGTSADGDVHWLAAVAYGSSLIPSSGYRGVNTFYRRPADQSIEFGPALSTPAASVVPTGGPYLRLRARLPVQDAYPDYGYFYFQYEEPEEFATIYSLLETRGYAGPAVTSWDVTVPDLSAVDGFQSSWMIQATQTTIRGSAAALSGGLTLATPLDAEYRPWFMRGTVPLRDGETDKYARKTVAVQF